MGRVDLWIIKRISNKKKKKRTSEITPKTIDYDWEEHKTRQKSSKMSRKERQDEIENLDEISSRGKEITSLSNEINKSNHKKAPKISDMLEKERKKSNASH